MAGPGNPSSFPHPPVKTRTHWNVLERRKNQIIPMLVSGLTPGEIKRVLEDPAKNKRTAPVEVNAGAIRAFELRHADEIAEYRSKIDAELFEETIIVKAERMRRYEAMDRALAQIHTWVVAGGRPDPEDPTRRIPLPEGFVHSVTSIAATRARILRLVAEEQGEVPRPTPWTAVGERGGELREDGLEVVTETMMIERQFIRTYEGVSVEDIG